MNPPRALIAEMEIAQQLAVKKQLLAQQQADVLLQEVQAMKDAQAKLVALANEEMQSQILTLKLDHATKIQQLIEQLSIVEGSMHRRLATGHPSLTAKMDAAEDNPRDRDREGYYR
jgi:hypothetical protein